LKKRPMIKSQIPNLDSRYIFFGTPDFAATILNKLIGAGLTPLAVVTNPDRPVGRKKVVTPPPVKQCLLKFHFNRVEILQPEKMDEDFIKQLRSCNAEVGVLAAYGKVIPKAVIDVFPKGIIVVHPSLLPKYRGATPIQSAILAGESETGTALILMDEKVDHGAIISNSKIQISNDDTYVTLSKKLAEASADLLIKTLPDYLGGKIVPKAQDHAHATYTKKFSSEDGFVDLEKNSPEEIWRKVRALNPEPGVFTLRQAQGKPQRMKILEADLVDGKLVLKKVQMEGGKSIQN